jgi:hypothetical protein
MWDNVDGLIKGLNWSNLDKIYKEGKNGYEAVHELYCQVHKTSKFYWKVLDYYNQYNILTLSMNKNMIN